MENRKNSKGFDWSIQEQAQNNRKSNIPSPTGCTPPMVPLGCECNRVPRNAITPLPYGCECN